MVNSRQGCSRDTEVLAANVQLKRSDVSWRTGGNTGRYGTSSVCSGSDGTFSATFKMRRQSSLSGRILPVVAARVLQNRHSALRN